jgi:hypothetical protein
VDLEVFIEGNNAGLVYAFCLGFDPDSWLLHLPFQVIVSISCFEGDTGYPDGQAEAAAVDFEFSFVDF